MQLNYLFCICLFPLALYAHDGDETPPTSEAKKAVLVKHTAAAVSIAKVEPHIQYVPFASEHSSAHTLDSPSRLQGKEEPASFPYWHNCP